jgi:hypothetical protein
MIVLFAAPHRVPEAGERRDPLPDSHFLVDVAVAHRGSVIAIHVNSRVSLCSLAEQMTKHIYFALQGVASV